jgi:hypothetical protein
MASLTPNLNFPVLSLSITTIEEEKSALKSELTVEEPQIAVTNIGALWSYFCRLQMYTNGQTRRTDRVSPAQVLIHSQSPTQLPEDILSPSPPPINETDDDFEDLAA